MLYTLIKLPIRLALRIFCAQRTIIKPELFDQKGPLLLVANHPNSFLDAVIIAAHFRAPVHFLARGDAFRNPRHNILLRMLQMIPVYRISEGKENLHKNEYAFQRSLELLMQNRIVLIFIEGICLNKHELQPFKKGAARIALSVVKEQYPLQVMPVSICYDNFNSFGKHIRLELSEVIPAKELFPHQEEAKNFQYFNEILHRRLSPMIQVPPAFQPKKPNLFALLGQVLHLPLYTPIKNLIKSKTKGTVFYDSVLFGVLLIVYPLYLVLLMLLFLLLHVPVGLVMLVILLHPLFAWWAVQHKITPRTIA